MAMLPEILDISITKDDIANGETGKPQSCALAQCMTRELTDRKLEFDGVHVDNGEEIGVRVANGWQYYQASTDDQRIEIDELISDFDKGNTIYESDFTLCRAQYIGDPAKN